MATTTVTVNGAKLGDTAMISHAGMTAGGWLLFGQGTANNVVTVTALNMTGRALTPTGTLRASIAKSWQV